MDAPLTARADARKVCWLLPWYKSSNPLTTFSIMANWDPATAGATMGYNDAMIQHNRNRLADRFVAAENFEWSLWVDDDMVLPIGNPDWFRSMTGLRHGKWTGKVLDGLLRHGKTIVSALYMGRDPAGTGRAMFAKGHAPELLKAIRKGEASGLQQVEWAGTGCLLVHRSVFVDMRKHFPHLAPKTPGQSWHYFTPMADSAVAWLGRKLEGPETEESITIPRDIAQSLLDSSLRVAHSGEDVAFGLRAAQIGHPTFVDFDVVCGHQGAIAWGPSNTRAQ